MDLTSEIANRFGFPRMGSDPILVAIVRDQESRSSRILLQRCEFARRRQGKEHSAPALLTGWVQPTLRRAILGNVSQSAEAQFSMKYGSSFVAEFCWSVSAPLVWYDWSWSPKNTELIRQARRHPFSQWWQRPEQAFQNMLLLSMTKRLVIYIRTWPENVICKKYFSRVSAGVFLQFICFLLIEMCLFLTQISFHVKNLIKFELNLNPKNGPANLQIWIQAVDVPIAFLWLSRTADCFSSTDIK